MTPHCADMDYERGILLVDVMQKSKDREEHFARQYCTKAPYLIKNQVLEGTKERLRLYRNHYVEVKTM